MEMTGCPGGPWGHGEARKQNGGPLGQTRGDCPSRVSSRAVTQLYGVVALVSHSRPPYPPHSQPITSSTFNIQFTHQRFNMADSLEVVPEFLEKYSFSVTGISVSVVMYPCLVSTNNLLLLFFNETESFSLVSPSDGKEKNI